MNSALSIKANVSDLGRYITDHVGGAGFRYSDEDMAELL
jgi:hypothetical protein